MKKDRRREIRLSEEEALMLSRKAKMAHMSESKLIRMLISGYNPPPAPDGRFFEAMNQISKLCEVLESLALSCSEKERYDFIKNQSENWGRFQYQMEKRYLLPERQEIKWQ